MPTLVDASGDSPLILDMGANVLDGARAADLATAQASGFAAAALVSQDMATAAASDAATSKVAAANAATAAAASKTGADASAAAALTSQNASADAAAAAASSKLGADLAAAAAQASAQAAGVFPNAYAAALPQGVTGTAITAGGSGGTAGTYALGVSGGPTGFAGTYTVSGGAVTAITITNPGLSASATAPTLSFPSGSVTGATATATVGTLIANQKTYWVASADGTQLLLYGNNGGAVATAPFGGTQLAVYGKAGVDAVAASFNTVYAQFDQTVIGTKIFRQKDASGRVIYDIDTNATVGVTFYTPVTVPANTIPLTALVNSPLALTNNEGNGYAYRWMSPDGVTFLGGIPTSYPARPADLTVLRARYADAFPGAIDSTGTWFLGGTLDLVSGQQTLWTRKVATGDYVAITTSGHAMAPRIDGTRALWVDGTSERAMYRPLDGSDIARPVNPGSAIIIIGDSTGQSLENASTGTVGGGMTTINGKVRRLYGISRGSQRTQAIAARYGVPGLVNITFPGGSIAATSSGATACTVDYDFLVDASGASANYGIAITVPGPSGAIAGALMRTYSGSAAVWAFTPTNLVSAVVVGTAAMPITVTNDDLDNTTSVSAVLSTLSIEGMRDVTGIIRSGRNDVGKSDFNQAACITQIQGIITRMTPLYKQVITLGIMQTYSFVPTGQGSDSGGTNTGTDAACAALFEADLAYNAALQAAFGTAYFDPVANHKAAGYTGTWTSTTTGKTYTYVTSAAIGDGTHENATGYTNTWAGLTAVIIAKGF
ncbi:MAG TPA: hypothetical protein VN222_10615 [Novosphingobium sp.]|nr:hypothetical protein [Novosphingobium sp.]